jgi:hypothetical protein
MGQWRWSTRLPQHLQWRVQAENLVDQSLLKLYIAYAKKHCHPKLQDADTEKMVQARTTRIQARDTAIAGLLRAEAPALCACQARRQSQMCARDSL